MRSQREALPEPIAIDTAKGESSVSQPASMSPRGHVPAAYEFEGASDGVAQCLAIHLLFDAS